jgi:hypothetical protein
VTEHKGERMSPTAMATLMLAFGGVALDANNIGTESLRRIWRHYGFYNVRSDGLNLTIWHLPRGKGVGFWWPSRDLVPGRIPDGSSENYLPNPAWVRGSPVGRHRRLFGIGYPGRTGRRTY